MDDHDASLGELAACRAAAQMQQQLIGTTLQKKQLSIEGVCAVEQVSMKSPSAGEQVIVKPPTGDCCPLPNAL